MREVTGEEVESYQTDGIVCLRGLFSGRWVGELRDAAELCMSNPGEMHVELTEERNDVGRFFHDTFMWTYNDTCKDFVFNSIGGRIARKLMCSSRINIIYDQWLIKEPGTTTKTPWHHDMTYWPVDGNQICSIWIALDSVTAANGAVEYIKGSHLWGQKFRAVSFSGNSQYTEPLPVVPDIESMRDQFDIVQFDLEPGDCTVHHGLCLHSSPGNQSVDNRRRAYVSRWAGDDVVFHPRDGLQEMPPLPDLKPGDPLDSKLWPRIL